MKWLCSAAKLVAQEPGTANFYFAVTCDHEILLVAAITRGAPGEARAGGVCARVKMSMLEWFNHRRRPVPMPQPTKTLGCG